MSKLLAMMMKPKNYMYATIKGSLTENDGVFSGFSASNYLSLQQPFALNTNTVADIVIKFNATSFENGKVIFGTYGYYGISLNMRDDGKLRLYIGNNTSSWSILNYLETNYTFSANTDYWINLSINKGVISILVSTDGKIYVSTASITLTLSQTTLYNLTLGLGRVDTAYFTGSIDLNQSYIKINNTKYQLQAVVGYTIVGSPTIVDGILTEPTDKQNTIKTNESLDVGDGSFEMQFCLLNPTIKASALFRVNGSNGTRCTFSNTNTFNLYPNYPRNSSVVLRALGNFWNNAVNNSASKVYLKIQCTGKDSNNEYPFIFSGSLDGITWRTQTIISSIPLASGIIQYCSSYTSFVSGASVGYDLNLKETWIKKDGKLWFSGQPSA